MIEQNHVLLTFVLNFATVSVMPSSGHFNVDNIRICKITVCYLFSFSALLMLILIGIIIEM